MTSHKHFSDEDEQVERMATADYHVANWHRNTVPKVTYFQDFSDEECVDLFLGMNDGVREIMEVRECLEAEVRKRMTTNKELSLKGMSHDLKVTPRTSRVGDTYLIAKIFKDAMDGMVNDAMMELPSQIQATKHNRKGAKK